MSSTLTSGCHRLRWPSLALLVAAPSPSLHRYQFCTEPLTVRACRTTAQRMIPHLACSGNGQCPPQSAGQRRSVADAARRSHERTSVPPLARCAAPCGMRLNERPQDPTYARRVCTERAPTVPNPKHPAYAVGSRPTKYVIVPRSLETRERARGRWSAREKIGESPSPPIIMCSAMLVF
jgi:hypothetical protein